MQKSDEKNIKLNTDTKKISRSLTAIQIKDE